MSYKNLVLFSLLLIMGLSSCNEDIIVQLDEPMDRPMIYFLLDPNDSVQYLRIQKIFLGSGSALETAQIADSIYPYGSKVTLSKVIGGVEIESYEMEELIDQPKDEGIFATQGHQLYRLIQQIETGATYQLSVTLPDHDKPILGETTPYSNLEILNVNRWPNGINMVNAKFAKVSWISLPEKET